MVSGRVTSGRRRVWNILFGVLKFSFLDLLKYCNFGLIFLFVCGGYVKWSYLLFRLIEFVGGGDVIRS